MDRSAPFIFLGIIGSGILPGKGEKEGGEGEKGAGNSSLEKEDVGMVKLGYLGISGDI